MAHMTWQINKPSFKKSLFTSLFQVTFFVSCFGAPGKKLTEKPSHLNTAVLPTRASHFKWLKSFQSIEQHLLKL